MVHISKDVQTDGEAEDRGLRARGDAVGCSLEGGQSDQVHPGPECDCHSESGDGSFL